MTTSSIASERPGKRRMLIGIAVAVVAVGAAWGALKVVQQTREPASTGGPTTMRRMNEAQYKRSIEQIFGADIAVPGRFEPSVREEGLLAVGDSKVVVTPAGFEQHAIRSREVSAAVLAEDRRKTAVQCKPKAANAFDEPCAQQFLGKYGRLLFRRPLSAKEMDSVLDVTRAATEQSGDFYKGLESGLARLLVSPSFIFRIETTEPDSNGLKLDAYSLASRISFLLWDAPPDEELLDAAESGGLRKASELERQVDRMMASPRFEQGVRAFFSDMFAYDLFSGLSKDNALFPLFSPQLRDDAEEQSLRTIVDHLLAKKGDYRDLFTTKNTFVSRSLGALYGIPVDSEAVDGWMPHAFAADDPRAGLLTLPAFLMLDPSHEGRSSPTIRGKTVRELFLCQTVPAPPGDVNFDVVQDINNPNHKTARDRLVAHSTNPTCAGCHAVMDPIGLAMENYDAVGVFRTHENGVEIDASGTLEGKSYRGLIELQKVMAESRAVPACLVKRVYEYGVGRQTARGEREWLTKLTDRFGRDGYEFPALIRRIATSKAFQTVSKDVVSKDAVSKDGNLTAT